MTRSGHYKKEYRRMLRGRDAAARADAVIWQCHRNADRRARQKSRRSDPAYCAECNGESSIVRRLLGICDGPSDTKVYRLWDRSHRRRICRETSQLYFTARSLLFSRHSLIFDSPQEHLLGRYLRLAR